MRRLLVLVVMCCGGMAHADPFDSCPPDAFLTQSAIATTYGVNLATGEYGLVENDMGVKGKVNATGFNPNDNYLYGWSYVHKSPARIGSDFQVEPLTVENVPNTTFYIGDVSYTTNEYVVYRNGSAYGLYAMGLDSTNTATYLKMRRIVNGSSISLNIYDMAFHPSNGLAYGVDKAGQLHKINHTSGFSTKIANVGVTGVFGAVYFDDQGILYISRNKDGKIFSIDVSNANYNAQFFANGPSASVNDGSRCALAPLVDNTNIDIDFGDAPDSYATYLTDNGARHGLSGGATLYLGGLVDGESDGSPFPMSDDEIDDSDDDDGVQFATGLLAGAQGVILVEASDTGYLNAWLDSNGNGEFDDGEQIVDDQLVGSGSNTVFVSVPSDAQVGNTWARFRLSSDAGTEATGGATDGEVEDYEVDITADDSSVTYYPSSNGWATIAFEDNWPIEGDYDMNDLVVYMRTAVYRRNGLVTQVDIEGEISAVGAAYQNGFGVRLPDVPRSAIDSDGIIYAINDIPTAPYNPLEVGANQATLMFMYNVWSYVSAGEDCTFYRTEIGCGSNIQARFSASIPFAEPSDVEISGVFDPFMFSTPGAWHGSHFTEAPGRSYEIHLKNQAPTQFFNYDLADATGGVDATDPVAGMFFQTDAGLPWALEIGTRWQYPREYIDILYAYPLFEQFVNTGGAAGQAWYLLENANSELLFVD